MRAQDFGIDSEIDYDHCKKSALKYINKNKILLCLNLITNTYMNLLHEYLSLIYFLFICLYIMVTTLNVKNIPLKILCYLFSSSSKILFIID